ncbi:MAG TPA: GNAT family N-acetyltransferase [Streptosporangiaceae bacterium]|nr:GNAT family N-acetyltransferase [Streptosporangiaceae bacterium]
MTTVAVNAVALDDIGPLLESVGSLFREDAGRHDSGIRNADWPAQGGLAYYSGIVDDPSCLLALARDADGSAVGHLVGKLSGPNEMLLTRIAVLESIRVAPEARGTGVGSALVRHFFAWARAEGAVQASVTAYAANETALRFYARHGFAPHSVTARATL